MAATSVAALGRDALSDVVQELIAELEARGGGDSPDVALELAAALIHELEAAGGAAAAAMAELEAALVADRGAGVTTGVAKLESHQLATGDPGTSPKRVRSASGEAHTKTRSSGCSPIAAAAALAAAT
jgi:hypothetical protein